MHLSVAATCMNRHRAVFSMIARCSGKNWKRLVRTHPCRFSLKTQILRRFRPMHGTFNIITQFDTTRTLLNLSNGLTTRILLTGKMEKIPSTHPPRPMMKMNQDMTTSRKVSTPRVAPTSISITFGPACSIMVAEVDPFDFRCVNCPAAIRCPLQAAALVAVAQVLWKPYRPNLVV